jgi:hypothetical protein
MPEDAVVRDLVNRHQRTDKGFGPAAGPDAAARVVACLAERGYHVEHEASDWRLSEDEGDIQRHLIEGWVQATLAIAPDLATLVQRWRAARLAHVEAGRSRLVVGHRDVWGWVR